MTTLYQPFTTLKSGERDSSTVQVDPWTTEHLGTVMRVRYASGKDLIITKQQAMDFFGLVDPSDEDQSNIYSR